MKIVELLANVRFPTLSSRSGQARLTDSGRSGPAGVTPKPDGMLTAKSRPVASITKLPELPYAE